MFKYGLSAQLLQSRFCWLQAYYSPASFNACCSISSVILNSVCLILASNGFIDKIMPLSFALIITAVRV